MNKETILARLASYPVSSERSPRQSSSPRDSSTLDRFEQNLSLSRARVIRVKESELVAAINRLLVEHEVKRLAYGLEAAVRPWVADLPGGVEGVCYSQAIEAFREELFSRIDAGLTGCDAALADTGTLVLGSSVKRPRLLSLVPPLHIAVLKAEQVYPGMADWLEAIDASHLPSNLILISGPSKSADIEQVLAYGVHGPKALVAFLIEAE